MCPIYMQGIGQMTPAQQTVIRQNNGTARRSVKRTNGSSKRSKKRSANAGGPTRKKKMKGMARKLVKGSAEAKRYMAKIRKMRK